MIVYRLCRGCRTGYPHVLLPIDAREAYNDDTHPNACIRCIDADTLRAVERLMHTLARAAVK